MIGDLKPYPEYRDSGVDWLAKLPVRWKVRRQSTVAELRVSNVDKHIHEDEMPVRLCNYLHVYKNERVRDDTPFSPGTATSAEIERFRLRASDVLITKDSESWNDIASPAFVESAGADLICGYHLAILRPRPEVLGAYLLRAHQAREIACQYWIEAKGVTRFGLTHSAINGIALPVPPLVDQTAIARYLDHVDSRIQRFIAAKERLIELLEEEKRGVIDRAVTKGLNANAPLKPSAILWLGDLPEAWEVLRAKWSFREVDERSLAGSEELLSVSHITGVTPRSEKSVTMFEPESYAGHKTCRAGDLVVNTMWAWMGALGISPRRGIVSPAYAVYRPIRPDFRSDYLELLLRSRTYIDEFIRRSTGIRPSRRRLYPPQFLTIPLVRPPLLEQDRILRAISDHPVSLAKERADRQITLLREYRTRLISDVVTGKLDLREAAASLPTDADSEYAQLDEALEKAVA